ncbi:MAG: carboxypeptidase regulatory-like domain-containing protein [Euryarchaeota archaeon]|nr:carboxypeptidase regulatory-like domain-containing protein [Euryarchaeota archaeon]
MRIATVALVVLALLVLPGCLGAGASEKKVRAEDIPFMVNRDKGAITGDMYYRNGNPVGNFRVRAFDEQNEVLCQVETQSDGKFYCQKLWPGTYRIEVNLKDWDDCTMRVYANRFTNLTIKEPTYSQAGKSPVCNYRP